MLIRVLIELFDRDLDKLIAEVKAFRREENLWHVDGDVKNSSGNLVLHLVGNLNHFIGATLGNTGYVRERDREFSDKDVPREMLIRKVEETALTVRDVLSGLDPATLNQPYPLRVFDDEEMTTTFFLVHLTTHLNYHLGQINYLRRLCD